MKNLYTYFLLIFVLSGMAFSSCSKEDDPEPTPADWIVGHWQLTRMEINGKPMAVTECEKKTFLQFNDDGTCTVDTYYMGGTECLNVTVEGTYSLSADFKKVSITDGTETQGLDILNLTANELTIQIGTQSTILKKIR